MSSLFSQTFWRFTLGFLAMVTVGLIFFMVFNFLHEQDRLEESDSQTIQLND